MARIQTCTRAGHLHLKVTGRLTARDVRRLEHACAPALTTGAVLLDTDVSGVTESDETATLIIRHMAQRGARIVPSRAGHSHSGGDSHSGDVCDEVKLLEGKRSAGRD